MLNIPLTETICTQKSMNVRVHEPILTLLAPLLPTSGPLINPHILISSFMSLKDIQYSVLYSMYYFYLRSENCPLAMSAIM